MKTARKSKSLRKAPLMASLTLACAMFAGNAGAGGIPTIDISHIIQSILKYQSDITEFTKQYGADLKEYSDQWERFNELREKYNNALSQLQGMLGNVSGANFQPQIKKISPTYGMEIECPGSGFSLGSLLESALPSMTGVWKAEQQRICQEIVYFENMKYNASVDVLNAMKERMAELDRLANSAVSGENDEAAKSGTLAMLDATNRSLTELQYSQAEISAYQTRIESLKRQQNVVARRAMEGDKDSILSKVVSGVAGTAALAIALEVQD